jgi:pimeloyl-ACP methyl ester carboxylesterase
MAQESNVTVVRQGTAHRAVVFVHGFIGDRDDTWGFFPTLLGTQVPPSEWDIYTIGYATTLLPDVVGVWSADPDLPILATSLWTSLGIPPFAKYDSIALIAHSMGGLVVQKALLEDRALAARLQSVVLFGTPSGGIRKASWVQFWKRQLRNMAEGSPFISDLRRDWNQRFDAQPDFNFLVVAGASDQFVPPRSSLEPFDTRFQRVVVGDHLAIVKPKDKDSPSLNLVTAILSAAGAPPPDATGRLSLAAERATPDASTLVGTLEAVGRTLTVKEVVTAALALERADKRDEAIALLERHKDLGTDVQGTLGGRMKRLWLETEDRQYADRALALYQGALDRLTVTAPKLDHDQIYYQAINVAFLMFVVYDQPVKAKEMAELALEHAELAGENLWSVATRAEANLYLGHADEAISLYRKMLTLKGEPWQHASAYLQAGQIAGKLKDRGLAESLEELFTPGARRVNRIFVSYSHRDGAWVERLKTMVAPYLRDAEAELDLWVDTRIKPGDQWDTEIREALARAGVAVALVSKDFLGSKYITSYELPEILKAAKDGQLRLLWAYLSPAGWEETPLKDFQATHDTGKPLAALPEVEQDEILKIIAQKIKEAALGATGRFRAAPGTSTG